MSLEDGFLLLEMRRLLGINFENKPATFLILGCYYWI